MLCQNKDESSTGLYPQTGITVFFIFVLIIHNQISLHSHKLHKQINHNLKKIQTEASDRPSQEDNISTHLLKFQQTNISNLHQLLYQINKQNTKLITHRKMKIIIRSKERRTQSLRCS